MRAAVIGTWHVHTEEYATRFSKAEGCALCAVWDPDPQKAAAFAGKYNVKAYSDLDKLYREEQFDAVIVCSATSGHVPLIVRAANEGKHIYTEKVLALSLDGAVEIQNAVTQNDVRLVISYPHKCIPGLIFAKQMIDEGKLGRVTYARMRNTHDGSVAGWLPPHFYDKAECGGGAMIDLGAHPMYILLWFLGEPLCISSAFTSVTGKPVEDNAVSLLTYENGAIGVSETGFVSRFGNFLVEVCGTEGAVRVTDSETIWTGLETDGKWIAAPLPQEPKSPMEQWIDWVTKGVPAPEFGIEEAVRLTKLMEAAYTAFETGKQAFLK